MRLCFLVFALAVSLPGCESKKAHPDPTPVVENKPTARAPLVDLTASSTLGAVRAAFNAHKGEARFLTLLSPT
jgi:hypothetical protein